MFSDHCCAFVLFFWPLYCLSFFNLRILITTFASLNLSRPTCDVNNECFTYYLWLCKLLCILIFNFFYLRVLTFSASKYLIILPFQMCMIFIIYFPICGRLKTFKCDYIHIIWFFANTFSSSISSRLERCNFLLKHWYM